jgi:hypothetical protein
MVLLMARLEAGSCEMKSNSKATFSDDTQMRVGKQLLAVKKPNPKRQSDSPYDEGGVVVSEDADDEREPIKQVTGPAAAAAILGTDETLLETQFRPTVRYHCEGWSEEVNSCILIISYMVYL